jgi:AraC-like DNA-binding protein
MDMHVCTLSNVIPDTLHDLGTVITGLEDRPGEPRTVVSPGRTWNGVSVSTVEMHWLGGGAQHRLTCKEACLSIVLEQIGGRYEHRSASGEPARHGGAAQRTMSLVPAGMHLWGYASSIRFVRSLRLTFDVAAIDAVLGERRIGPALAIPRLMFSHDTLWQISNLLAAESNKAADHDRLYGESLSIALCIELLRLGEADARAMHRGGLAPWQMRRINEYMQEHLCDPIQLSDFAKLTGMSRSHFSQAFRRSTGVPPHRWHLNARIQRAQALLLDTGLPLAEVAVQTGFADQSHFTKIFQRQVGTSPGVWRRERRS